MKSLGHMDDQVQKLAEVNASSYYSFWVGWGGRGEEFEMMTSGGRGRPLRRLCVCRTANKERQATGGKAWRG